jgi:TonB family protein
MFDNWTSARTGRPPGMFLSVAMHMLVVTLLLQRFPVIRNPHLHMDVIQTAAIEPVWLPVAPPTQPRVNANREVVHRTSVPPDVRLFTPEEHLTAGDENSQRSIDPSLTLVPELNIAQEVLQARLETMPRVVTDPPVLSAPSLPAIETNAAPPAPPPPRIGGQVEPAQLVKQVVPVYPQMARTARVEGAVTVDAIIQPSGKLTELKVVEGHPLLIDAALQALRQWRYKPAKLNGTAVESPVHINVVFRLVFPN